MKARPLMGATMAVTCTLLIAVAFRLSPLGHAASTRRTEMDGLNAAALIPTLHRMNEIEIDAGRMAQSNSASEAVKDYGRQLEQDHQAADQDLEAFAQARSVSTLCRLRSPRPYSHGSGPRISSCSSQASRYQTSGTMRGFSIRFMAMRLASLKA